MSSIDLVILGIVMEKPQSAYDIQKDVEYHHLSRWTKISVPSIYRKVLQMNEQGYLKSSIVKGDKFADKAVYSITDKGWAYFGQLMETYADQKVPSYPDIPLGGKAIFEQQRLLYQSLLEWLDKFESQFRGS